MRRALISTAFILVAFTRIVCQIGDPALKKGKVEDLKGATKVYIGATEKSKSLRPLIAEAIHLKLPQLTFVSVQEESDVWLLISEEIDKEIEDTFRSSDSPVGNNSSARSVVSVLKIRCSVIRHLGSMPARLVGKLSVEGSPADRSSLAKDIAKEFVDRYRKVNPDAQADITHSQRVSGAGPKIRKADNPIVTATAPYPGVGTDNSRTEVDENEIVRIDTSLVTVHASVIGRDGRPETGLGPKDFSVYEDGVRQEVAFFEPTHRPFTVVLLIDSSSSIESRLGQIAAAANILIDSLTSDDQLVVVTFGNEVTEITKPTRVGDLRGEGVRLSPKGGTRLYDAVNFVADKYLRTSAGRKAVVLLTDGIDNGSFVATAEGSLSEAEELDALFYTVQYDTPERLKDLLKKSTEKYERATAYLRAVAEKTGGRYYHADSAGDIAPALALAVEELSRQYTLGYYPRRQPQPGERRWIRVRVSRPDLVVRARDSFVFKSADSEQARPK